MLHSYVCANDTVQCGAPYIICLGQLFGVTLMATAGALSTYQYKLDQQEQYEQYLKDKEIRERRERGEEL